jgi:uracil-DNA glycosylase
LFGADNGYIASHKRVRKEQSATAMWSVLEELEVLPLLWNAFPFHPYKKDNKDSNRKPNSKELEIGKSYLFELIELFDIKRVIAVGNVADHILNKMEIAHTKVRHPSYGGKKDFKEQLRYNLKKENL